MKQKAKIGTILMLGVLAACGKVGPLEPKAGQAPPAKAIGQSEVPGSEALMEPSIQARPGRSDELMRRSERRVNDPFDLPPGSDEAEEKPAPAPANTTTTPK
jgi:predicted small lipoprotein YifL